MCFEGLARLSRRVWRRFVRGSREISLVPSLHRASTDALIMQVPKNFPLSLQDLIGSYNCLCTSGFSGPNCQLFNECLSSPCLTSPCLNGGVCQDLVLGYSCNCEDGFYVCVSCIRKYQKCLNYDAFIFLGFELRVQPLPVS